MATGVPQEPIKLRFDPNKARETVQRVFADPIARTLWLMVKITHRVDQTFDDWCLTTADKIRKSPAKSLKELHGLIRPERPFRAESPRFLSDDWEESRDWLERVLAAIEESSPIRFEVETA